MLPRRSLIWVFAVFAVKATFDSRLTSQLTCFNMTRFRLTTVILLLLPLLLLPLQGHARSARADLGMPCAMDHQAMHDAHVMAAEKTNNPYKKGASCTTQCQDCAGCAYCPVGIALTLEALPLPLILQTYTVQSPKTYSPISLFKDHPPPRFV